MDKSWMTFHRCTKQYVDGVESFLSHYRVVCKNVNRIPCPCEKCGNYQYGDIRSLRDNFIINGVDKSYTHWVHHGENSKKRKNTEVSVKTVLGGDDVDAPYVAKMVDELQDELLDNPENLHSLLSDAEKPLYPGCAKFTKLSILVRLFNLKPKFGCNDVMFSELLELLRDMLLKNNELPTSLYLAKKTLAAIGLGYTKIHACRNDCILYRKEFESLEQCPVCNESRWKKRNNPKKQSPISAKVLWHIPIIPCLRRLFRNSEHAENLTWHANKRVDDGMLRHPADSPSWKHVDSLWPAFAKEPRNLRLALSADGINPHSTQSSRYRCWPVLLVIYNLPLWLCMKRKFMLMSLLISDPEQPGNDIDVYLAPLIDDLKELWENGIHAFDAYSREDFTLKALLMWTINDYPAYDNLSGCSVKGYNACPICGEDKEGTLRLEHGKKVVYMGHRWFLPLRHPFRRQMTAFNGKKEFGIHFEYMFGYVLVRIYI